jgi:hypothetical protein
MGVLDTIEQMQFAIWIRESSSIWAFPTFLVVHTIGMSIVAGCSLMISLALLGFWPHKMPMKPLERLYPVMWIGFWVNAFTGTMLLLADASTKATNWDFYLKMVFVFAGVYLMKRTRKQIFGSEVLDTGVLPIGAKGLAWGSMICWFAAITAGRLLAYLGPVTGLIGIENK